VCGIKCNRLFEAGESKNGIKSRPSKVPSWRPPQKFRNNANLASLSLLSRAGAAGAAGGAGAAGSAANWTCFGFASVSKKTTGTGASKSNSQSSACTRASDVASRKEKTTGNGKINQ
jgi:hypothetical protein